MAVFKKSCTVIWMLTDLVSRLSTGPVAHSGAYRVYKVDLLSQLIIQARASIITNCPCTYMPHEHVHNRFKEIGTLPRN